jgi:hypothetical protein
MCASKHRADPASAAGDPHIERLARFFRDEPAWAEAARFIDPEAASRVAFSHRPGEAWRVVRRSGTTVLERGTVDDPDFELLFTPGAIERITAVRGGVGSIAVALFAAIVDADPERRADLRIIAPFSRLVRRGYVRLLIAAGPAVLAFGARHGIHTLGDLRRLVRRLRPGDPP